MNSSSTSQSSFFGTGALLEVRGVCKSFSGVQVLKGVDFSLKSGEIHALMGENGAGKSTLINILTGVYQADSGEILLDGERVVLRNTNSSRNLSIAAIYQHGTAFPHLNVAENIFMGQEPAGLFGLLNWKKMYADAESLLRKLGSSINPRSMMDELTTGEQQIVEIAKALSARAKILIMDEPTAALSWRESQELYRITRQLQKEGCSVVLVSHRLEDIRALAERITILRDGEYIGTWNVSDIGEQELLTAMAGRKMTRIYPERTRNIGEEVFKIEHFSRTGFFKDISLTLHKGEILALTGLVGAGRTEVIRSVLRIDKPNSGSVFLEGELLKIRTPRDAMDAGIGFLPEDRLHQGLLPEWSIGENITLGNLRAFISKTLIRRRKERKRAAELASSVQVKARSVFDSVRSLSGGNQQKVVFAKMLNSELKVMILDEPTKGVDVGAKSQIYQLIADCAAKGCAVLMISSELPEVLGMADTVAVMRDGILAGVFDNCEGLTQEKILQAAMQS